MTQEVSTKCPNCGLLLTAEHRKGNLMRCPACKTIFEIKQQSSQILGKCPHRCGETMKVDDYVDDARLQCVHCHEYSLARTASTNEPWDSTQEAPVLLFRYLGKCPNCNEAIGDSDRDSSGNLVCRHCDTFLVSRPHYNVSEKIGICPICDEPLGKGDIREGNRGYCQNCNQSFILDPTTSLIPEGNLFALPFLTSDEFIRRCFELLYLNAPADIASQLEIKEVSLSFEPVAKGAGYEETVSFPHNFQKSDFTSIGKVFGGKVEMPREPDTSSANATKCYLPQYELSYRYKQQDRKFRISRGKPTIQADNLPEYKRLTGEGWLTNQELSLTLVGLFIIELVWWWNSSHGFLNGLWNLILAVVFGFIMVFIVFGSGHKALTRIMRARCQNRKLKEFKSVHGLDYSGLK